MNKNQVVTIAAQTNTSPATVSKVLNHRRGVGSAVRQLIFREYDRMGYHKKAEPVSIYVILPEIPIYFWSSKQSPTNYNGMRIKYNIYSRIGDDEIVLRYLHQAIELKAKAIVIAARLNDEMRELLDRFSENGIVIYLTEYNQTRDSVYVGSDPAEDGRQLGQLYRRHMAEGDRLLLITQPDDQWNRTSNLRYQAFLETLGNAVSYGVCAVDLQVDTSLMPSLWARMLRSYLADGAYNRVICFTGFTHTLCLAVQKMHLPPPESVQHDQSQTTSPILCFGFEDTPQNSKLAEKGVLGGVVSQDFSVQLNIALTLAGDFVVNGKRPPETNMIIPCNILEY